MASGPFTLARLADAAGLSFDDVRFYRDCRLLQPPRRQAGRNSTAAYHAEHLERLKFIQRARDAGYTPDDIARLVDPGALVTCGDVYALTTRRLEALRVAGEVATREAACLATLRESCAGVGSGKDCSILEELSGPNRCCPG
jgi:DNA-binding transcriptional MerR regulator